MYSIEFSKRFLKQFNRLTKTDKKIEAKIEKALDLISKDPFYPSLKTHKYQDSFSSSVTGDLRILWDYGEEKLTILAIDLGGHSGKHSVYKRI
ncbi:MAG: type II toxin-antitoxin system YoeB family toxin [Candidatus Margulisbacteria bacterium]|nr:type II toxin-antitoxin system YoeB family toxin [Candidatus Margulisiibacteriota bacterium]